MAALMALVAVCAMRQIWDIDVFWHVVAGRLITERGLGISHDTFSAIDPERAWVPLAWGYHVWTYFVDRAWGLPGLRVAHAVVQVVAFALFYFTCRRRLGIGRLPSLVLFALLLVLYADRFRARPHVWNLLFEVTLLPLLARGPRGLDRAACILTAVVMALWANLHGGGALVFLGIAAAIPAAALVDRLLRVPGREGNLRRASAWFACAIVPALISPLWVRAVLHTFTMVDATYEYTYEWHPSFRLLIVGTLPAHFIAGLFPSVMAVALVFPVAKILAPTLRGGVASLRKALAEYELHRVLLGVALAYITHRSLRFVYMSAFTCILQAPLLATAFGGFNLPERARRAALAFAGVCLVAAGYQSRVTALYGSLGGALTEVLHGGPLVPGRFPEAQADFLARTGFEGRIFCQAAWGGYLLYRLWPRALVLADGRGNHDASVTRDLRIIGNPANMTDPANGPVVLEIYDRYATDALVLNHPAWPTGYTPPRDHWREVEGDPIGGVWVRPAGAGRRYLEHLAELQAAGLR